MELEGLGSIKLQIVGGNCWATLRAQLQASEFFGICERVQGLSPQCRAFPPEVALSACPLQGPVLA